MAESHRRARRPRYTDAAAPESRDLLHRARHGDREAFGRIYATHLDLITRYVAVRLRDVDRYAIPDVVHDAFTDALAELADAHDDVTGWLLQLAARACTRHRWASRRAQRAVYEVRDYQRTTAPTVSNPSARTLLTRLLAMAPLTASQRQAIQLRYFDGYPRDRAAQVMGRSSQAIRDLERRALRNLHRSQADAASTPGAGRQPLTTSALPDLRPTR